MKKKSVFALSLLLITPLSVFAANVNDLQGLIGEVVRVINLLVPLLFGLAMIGFMWGVIKYIAAHDPKNIREASNYMIFSIIAIAVMLSVWGLAFLVKNSLFQDAPTQFNVNMGVGGN